MSLGGDQVIGDLKNFTNEDHLKGLKVLSLEKRFQGDETQEESSSTRRDSLLCKRGITFVQCDRIRNNRWKLND